MKGQRRQYYSLSGEEAGPSSQFAGRWSRPEERQVINNFPAWGVRRTPALPLCHNVSFLTQLSQPIIPTTGMTDSVLDSTLWLSGSDCVVPFVLFASAFFWCLTKTNTSTKRTTCTVQHRVLLEKAKVDKWSSFFHRNQSIRVKYIDAYVWNGLTFYLTRR